MMRELINSLTLSLLLAYLLIFIFTIVVSMLFLNGLKSGHYVRFSLLLRLLPLLEQL